MWITCAGEPSEIVRETVKHAKIAADHYEKTVHPNKKPRVIVLNDAKGRGRENWYEVADICKELGVHHIAREKNTGFKAGNINNGLAAFPSDDPHNTIDCFFDTDFCAKKEFLTEILKPMTDNSVDFIQSPQRYKSYDTWVAKAASAHQIFFFDYICPAKAYDNALFLCGTNYAIRRSALMDVGGVDTNYITEDYATSINLHLAGKKGIFIPKVLALGLAPMTLKEYFSQQSRWGKGSFDTNFQQFKRLFFGKLTLRQKFHYFLSATYYLIGLRDLILMLAPLPYLFFGVSLIRTNSIGYLAMIYAPLLIYNFLLYVVLFRSPIKSIVLDLISFPTYTLAFLSSVLKKNLAFIITVKQYERENPFKVYRIQLAVASLITLGLIYSFFFGSTKHNGYGNFINYFWAIFDAAFLFLGFFLVAKENYDFKVSFTYETPRFLKPFTNIAPAAIKLALVLIASFVTGIAAPIVYNSYAKDTLMQNQYIQAAGQISGISKTQELVVPGVGVYYGYYQPKLNEHPENVEVKVVENENPSLAMFYQDWNSASLFDTTFMNNLSNKGVVPVVTWEPLDAQNTDSELNKAGNPQAFILNGSYDQYIRQWARAAKSYKKPFFLRFAHEMNGNWYAWGNDAESYKAMWIHVHTIFEEEGATNVIWVWSPNNTNQFGETEGVLEYYPGDEYVDWTAYSAFNWGDANYKKSLWRTFNTMSFDIYNTLSTLNKPIMVAETSSVSAGGDKTGWFYQTLQTYIPQMSKIKAVVIFNQDYGSADFSLDSGMKPSFVIEENIISNDYYLKEPMYVYR